MHAGWHLSCFLSPCMLATRDMLFHYKQAELCLGFARSLEHELLDKPTMHVSADGSIY
jgi:hypothetical protein